MDTNGLTGSYIYTNTSLVKEDIIQEKIELLAMYLYDLARLNSTFSNNDSLQIINEYVTLNLNLLLGELDFEHQIYDNILNYLAESDDLESLNLETLKQMDYILNIFESIEEERVTKFACITSYYDNLIKYHNLNKLTAKTPVYNVTLTEGTKELIRKLMPGK